MKKICCILVLSFTTLFLSSCSRILINSIENALYEYVDNRINYYEYYDNSYNDSDSSNDSYDNSYENSYNNSYDNSYAEESSDSDSSNSSPATVSMLDDMEYIKKTSCLTLYPATDSKYFFYDVEENSYSGNVIYPSGGTLSSQNSVSEDDSYISYYLNKKYSTLSGTIYRPYGSLSCTYTWSNPSTIKIYGDDVLLYEAPNITQDTYSPIDFEVDVNGVRELKIVMLGVWTESTWPGQHSKYPKACMANLILSK